MSNFQCPHCGMINVDCGDQGYKTSREIELEKQLERLYEKYTELKAMYEGLCK